jgi:hypothetical protein
MKIYFIFLQHFNNHLMKWETKASLKEASKGHDFVLLWMQNYSSLPSLAILVVVKYPYFFITFTCPFFIIDFPKSTWLGFVG